MEVVQKVLRRLVLFLSVVYGRRDTDGSPSRGPEPFERPVGTVPTSVRRNPSVSDTVRHRVDCASRRDKRGHLGTRYLVDPVV